jgi:hypothetical protein
VVVAQLEMENRTRKQVVAYGFNKVHSLNEGEIERQDFISITS